MKLSRTAGYGIAALLQLARLDTNEPVSCTRLAEQKKLPDRFLLQVLRRLVTNGILRSTRGIEGGYSFAVKPEEVSILQVIEAIDGPLNAEVPPEVGLPDEAHEKLEQVVKASNDAMRKHLSALKLSQLAGGRKRRS